MVVENTLAYYDTATVMVVKSFGLNVTIILKVGYLIDIMILLITMILSK
jgi:hypothetical protein